MYWQRAIYLLLPFLMACAVGERRGGREQEVKEEEEEVEVGGGRSSTQGPVAPPRRASAHTLRPQDRGLDGKELRCRSCHLCAFSSSSSSSSSFSSSLLLPSLHLALFHQSNGAPPQRGADATGCKLNINLYRFERRVESDLCCSGVDLDQGWFRIVSTFNFARMLNKHKLLHAEITHK